MPGLTAKVFRTYNASITLDEMLNKETKDWGVAEKVVIYQHANKEVAIICNHQRSISKSHSAQMSRLTEKITELKDAPSSNRVVSEAESDPPGNESEPNGTQVNESMSTGTKKRKRGADNSVKQKGKASKKQKSGNKASTSRQQPKQKKTKEE